MSQDSPDHIPASTASSLADPQRPARQSLHANMTWMTISVVLANAVRFATHWLMAWISGAKVHSRFTLVFQFISLLLVIGELGIVSTFGVKKIAAAAAKDRNLVGRVISVFAGTLLLTNVVISIALWLFAHPIGQWLDTDPALLYSVALWPIGFAIYRITVMLAGGLEATVYAARTTILFYTVWIVWLIITFVLNSSIETLFWGWSALFMLAGGAGWLLIRPLLKSYKIHWQISSATIVDLITTSVRSIPYAIAHSGTILLGAVACLLLAHWGGADKLSYFQIVFSLAMLVQVIAIPVAYAILPVATRLKAKDTVPCESIQTAIHHVLRLLTMIGTLSVTLFWLAGTPVLELLGTDYSNQHYLLLALAAVAAIDIHRILFDQILIAENKIGVVAIGELIRYGVLVIAAMWLVPPLGIDGMVLSIAVAVCSQWVIKAAIVLREIGNVVLSEQAKLVSVLMVLAAVGYLSKQAWLILSAWLITMVVFQVCRKDDLAWIRSTLFRRAMDDPDNPATS